MDEAPRAELLIERCYKAQEGGLLEVHASVQRGPEDLDFVWFILFYFYCIL
jgi:hypothetical protein